MLTRKEKKKKPKEEILRRRQQQQQRSGDDDWDGRVIGNVWLTYAFDGGVDWDADIVVADASGGRQSLRPRMLLLTVMIGQVLIAALGRHQRANRWRLFRHAETLGGRLINP